MTKTLMKCHFIIRYIGFFKWVFSQRISIELFDRNKLYTIDYCSVISLYDAATFGKQSTYKWCDVVHLLCFLAIIISFILFFFLFSSEWIAIVELSTVTIEQQLINYSNQLNTWFHVITIVYTGMWNDFYCYQKYQLNSK